MKDKYQISYTLKDPLQQGFSRAVFKTKKEANEWIKNNKKILYWHKLVEINPKSKFPKPIVKFDPKEGFVCKKGTLQTYFETGMECLGLILYEDGIHGELNPNFDSEKEENEENFKFYSSYEGVNFIKHGDILQIEDEPKIAILKDIDFSRKDGYRLSVYPRGFSRFELLEIFSKHNIKAMLWVKSRR